MSEHSVVAFRVFGIEVYRVTRESKSDEKLEPEQFGFSQVASQVETVHRLPDVYPGDAWLPSMEAK